MESCSSPIAHLSGSGATSVPCLCRVPSYLLRRVYRQHCQTDVPLVDVCKWGALNFTQHNDAYRALQCHQNPPDCSSVKYLVVFQTHYKIGFGWTSYFESLVLAFALKHNRVLIEGAEMPECPEKYNWRWCPEVSDVLVLSSCVLMNLPL
jgi:hypothetical protein